MHSRERVQPRDVRVEEEEFDGFEEADDQNSINIEDMVGSLEKLGIEGIVTWVVLR